MTIPVFLSSPKCHLQSQELFLSKVEEQLREMGLEPRTLGRSDYDMDAPMTAIRRLMAGSCGLITLAFRRSYIEKGEDRPDSDKGEQSSSMSDQWLTSPYCQIEPAMAYQIGLPILIWREKGVRSDGVLDRGALGLSMPEFDVSRGDEHLNGEEWGQPFRLWCGRVLSVYERRGLAPVQWTA